MLPQQPRFSPEPDGALVTRELPPGAKAKRTVLFLSAIVAALIWFFTGERWIPALVGGSCALLAICAEARIRRLLRGQRWLVVQDDGFALRRGDDSRVYRDRDVESVAYATFSTLNNGAIDGNFRRFRVWMTGQEEPLLFEHYFTSSDPLLDLIERLITVAVAKADLAVQVGGSTVGEKWRLQGATLMPDRGIPLALADMTAVRRYDGQVCVWQKSKLAAEIKVPVDTRNAIVLERLLQARLADRGADSDQPEADDVGLGHLLFQRRNGYVVPGILLCIGLLVFLGGLFSPDPVSFGIVAAVFGAVGGVMLTSGRSFFCHERGVAIKGVLARRILRYDNMAYFTYDAVRHYRNRLYEGTRLTLSFEPLLGSGYKSVCFQGWIKGADADLDELRNFIARVLARQLNDRLERQGSAAWTADIRFLSDGLEVVSPRILGKSEPAIIPFSACDRFEFTNGTLMVFPPQQEKPVLTLHCSDVNFFPGFFLLQHFTGKACGA